MSSAENTTKYAMLACDVFEEELKAFGGENPPWKTLSLLEMGLHDFPDRLREEVQSEVNRLEEDPEITHIVLAYALCGNGLLGITSSRKTLIIPRGHDCITVLLGSVSRHLQINHDQPGNYFYSPGWIRGKRVPGPDRDKHLREFYMERYDDDEEMVEELLDVDKESFEHNNCAVYVDLTNNTEAVKYCQDCAKHQGWGMEKHEGDATLFKDLLAGNWDEERFLIVPPGSKIGLSHDNSIFKVEPLDS